MVRTGIDRMISEGRHKGAALGIVTNPSAVTREGQATWKALLDAGYRISAFFGPEHGFRGDAQDGVEVQDSTYMGVPSYSLFGSRLEPEPAMLKGLDFVVYDIQDVGCRYYTYLYTLANVMKVAEGTGTKVLVLDRPDPIGGLEVEGAPMPDGEANFVGAYRLPARYGMTVGEFAFYLKGEFFPKVDLEVVEVEGWARKDFFDQTGLPWITPSPNIPSLATALVYPGTCLFEGTNLSEGRGSTRPFETLGAPWIDGIELRDHLAALGIPALVISPAAYTPTFSKHQGKFCGGITLNVTDRLAFRPLYAGIAILKAIHDHYPKDFQWKPTWEDPARYYTDRLAGGSWLRTMIDEDRRLDDIYAAARAGEGDFLARRAAYLLYA